MLVLGAYALHLLPCRSCDSTGQGSVRKGIGGDKGASGEGTFVCCGMLEKVRDGLCRGTRPLGHREKPGGRKTGEPE